MRKYQKNIINKESIEKNKGFFNLYEEEYKFEMPNIIYPISSNVNVRCKCGNKFRIEGRIDEKYNMRDIISKSSLFTAGGDITDIYKRKTLVEVDDIITCAACGLTIIEEDSVIIGENRYFSMHETITSPLMVNPDELILNKINYFVNDFVDENGEIFKKYSLSLMMMVAFTNSGRGYPVVNKQAVSLIFSFNEKDGFVRYSIKDVNSDKLLCTTNISNIIYDKDLNKYNFMNNSKALFPFLAELNDLGYFPKELKERMIRDLNLEDVLIEYGAENINNLNLLDFIIFYKFRNLSKDFKLINTIDTHILINTLHYFRKVTELNDHSANENDVDPKSTIKLIELRRRNFLNTINKGEESIYFENQILEVIKELFLLITIGNISPSKELLDNVENFFKDDLVKSKLIENPLSIFGQHSLFIPTIKDPKVWLKMLEENEDLMNKNIKFNNPSLKSFYAISFMRFISFKEQAFYSKASNGDYYYADNNNTFFREGSKQDGVDLSKLGQINIDSLCETIKMNEIYMNKIIRGDNYISYIAIHENFNYELLNDLYKLFFNTHKELSIVEYFNFDEVLKSLNLNKDEISSGIVEFNKCLPKSKLLPELVLEKNGEVIEIKEVLLQDMLSIPGLSHSDYNYRDMIKENIRFLLLKSKENPEVILVEVVESLILGEFLVKSIIGNFYSKNGEELIKAAGYYANHFDLKSITPEINYMSNNGYNVIRKDELNYDLEQKISFVSIDDMPEELSGMDEREEIPSQSMIVNDEALPF